MIYVLFQLHSTLLLKIMTSRKTENMWATSNALNSIHVDFMSCVVVYFVSKRRWWWWWFGSIVCTHTATGNWYVLLDDRYVYKWGEYLPVICPDLFCFIQVMVKFFLPYYKFIRHIHSRIAFLPYSHPKWRRRHPLAFFSVSNCIYRWFCSLLWRNAFRET